VRSGLHNVLPRFGGQADAGVRAARCNELAPAGEPGWLSGESGVAAAACGVGLCLAIKLLALVL